MCVHLVEDLIGSVRPSFAGFLGGVQVAAAAALACCLGVGAAEAQDATWSANPLSNFFDVGVNWGSPPATPTTPPTGTGFFNTSNTTSLQILFATPFTVGTLQFNPGASAFLRYDGDISTYDSSHALSIGLRVTW